MAPVALPNATAGCYRRMAHDNRADHQPKTTTTTTTTTQLTPFRYGRNFFTRYDYETITNDGPGKMMENLRALCADPSGIVGRECGTSKVKSIDDFSYTDVTNKEVTEKQGIRIVVEDGSRIIFRLSGTGSSGATIRLYVDSYYNDPKSYTETSANALKPMIDAALAISDLEKLTGRNAPTVIT